MKETFRTEEEFIQSSPNSGHRSRFIDRLEKEEKKKDIRWMPWLIGISSAAVALWAVITITLIQPVTPIAEEEIKQQFDPMTALSERSEKLEGIYTQYVEPKIPAILENKPELKKQLKLLDQLDAEYAKLKTLFIKTEGHEAITREMLRNHKLRLQLMEQMLHQIEIIKSKKLKKNEIKSA